MITQDEPIPDNQFCATIQCPFNILFGKQTGNLASEEDKTAWATRCNGRRWGFMSDLVTLVLETRVGNAAWNIAETVTITGKQNGEYLEAHVINAPDTKPFDIRVRRITPDSTVDTLVNGTIWNSYVEITDDNLNYPFSAIAGSVIDRDQYTDTPSRTYHLRGLIVDVPDNYDPINRTYSGLWTGGFKAAWTNNPAWLFRALVKNNRYGLSRRAGYIDVDDGSLYILSQYCDQLVDDGYGGREPRMTLNAYITEQASARDILDNIAGMFRGIALWDGMRLMEPCACAQAFGREG